MLQTQVHESTVVQTLLEAADAQVLNADGNAVPWVGDKAFALNGSTWHHTRNSF